MINRDTVTPRIGEVYNMYFDGIGSEQGGWRPGLVFQNNIGNRFSPNIIALPLTSNTKRKDMPTHVLLRAEETGLKVDSIVLCENPQRISKNRLGFYILSLSDADMKKVAAASLLASAAISYLDMEMIMEVWKEASKMNGTGGDC